MPFGGGDGFYGDEAVFGVPGVLAEAVLDEVAVVVVVEFFGVFGEG